MTRTLLTRLLIALFTATLVLPTLADEASVRAEIETTLKSIAQSMSKKDVNGVLSHVTSDYRQVGAKGAVQNKKQLAADLKRTFADAESIKSYYNIESIRVNEKSAVSVMIYNISILSKPVGKEKTKHRIEAKIPMQAFWTNFNGVWKVTKMIEQPGAKLTIDGKFQKMPS